MRAQRWYIGPTAMPRAAVTPIAIGCDSRPRHCKRDNIPAWRPNKITLLSLSPLDLTMHLRFISFFPCGSVPWGTLIYSQLLFVSHDRVDRSSRLRADLRESLSKTMGIQSAGSISNSTRCHSDASIALGPILKMYIPGQIRIFNALNSDGYSTGNAPPSGNNEGYHINVPSHRDRITHDIRRCFL